MAKCENKKKYGTEKNANRGRMNLWGADPRANLADLHVYQCPECGFWHVGHRSTYEKYVKPYVTMGVENS